MGDQRFASASIHRPLAILWGDSDGFGTEAAQARINFRYLALTTHASLARTLIFLLKWRGFGKFDWDMASTLMPLNDASA